MKCAWIFLAAVACSSPQYRPPAAPGELSAVFSRSSVALRWGAVAGATSYDVRVTHGAEEQVFSTNLTSIGVQWTGALSGLAISVRSVIGRGAGEWSAPILQPDRLPSITVRIDRAGAHLSWDASFGKAVVGRRGAVGAIEAIGETEAGAWDDLGLPFGSRFFWSILVGTPPVQQLSDVAEATTVPLPPSGFRVEYSGQRFTVFWDPGIGAGSYAARLTNDAGTVAVNSDGPSYGPTDCGGSATCSLEVAALAPDGVAGDYAPPLRITNPPDVPTTADAYPGVDRILLRFPVWPAFADHLRIFRVSQLGFDAVEVGVATRDGFTDTGMQRWTRYGYNAIAVTSDGVQSVESRIVDSAFATSPPSLVNLGDAAAAPDPARSHGQTVVMPNGGRLLAVELATSSVLPAGSGLALSNQHLPQFPVALPAAASHATDSLDPSLSTGTLFGILGAGLAVSAGEALTFELVPVTHVPIAALVSQAAAGAHLRDGSPDPDHDLLYKLYIAPDSSLLTPASPGVREGVHATALWWPAVPGAVRYEIDRLRFQIDPGFALLASTDQPSFVDRDVGDAIQEYRVRAIDAAGAASNDSFVASASTLIYTSVAAENRGDAPSSELELCSPDVIEAGAAASVEQTFTTQTAGTLGALEMRVQSGTQSVRVEILSAAGSLGSVTGAFDGPRVSSLLDSLPGQTVDLDPLGIPVAVGDVLTARLTIPAGQSGCTWLRQTGDMYAGGEQIRDGVAHPEADLAFRVLLR